MNLRLLRWFILKLLLGGTVLLVYHKRVGLSDPNGMLVARLLMRPDLWFGLAVLLAMVVMTRRCLVAVNRSPSATKALSIGPWLALATGILGSLVGWWRYGVGMSDFGIQESARMVLCTLLVMLVYNFSIFRPRFASSMWQLLVAMPALNVIFALGVLLLPSLVQTIFGASMLDEGDGLFSFGARYQGLTSNPNMVASSSCIAFALLLPSLRRELLILSPRAIGITLYAIGLVGVIGMSGVRSMALALPILVAVDFWLSFRLTERGMTRLIFAGVTMGAVALFGAALLWRAGTADVMLERFESGDGRLFLWKIYIRTLLENPLGLGFGFESIVHADEIIVGQRLPPHNTLLQMSMYGGLPGLFVHLGVLGVMIGVILHLRYTDHRIWVPLRIQSLILGWLASVMTLFFSGMIFIDFYYALLSALLLAEVGRYRLRLYQTRINNSSPDYAPYINERII